MDNKSHHNFEVRRILTEYEVPYEKGAWESFEQKRDRKRRFIVWYRAAGIAASISLVALAVLFRNELLPGSYQETANSRKEIENDTTEQKIKDIGIAENGLAIAKDSSSQNFNSNKLTEPLSGKTALVLSSTEHLYNNTDIKEEDAPIDLSDLSIKKIKRLEASFTLPSLTIPTLEARINIHSQLLEKQELIIQRNIEELEAKTSKNPVVFGIALSSLVSSSSQTSSPQPGLGGGFTTEIPFNDKLALYTGLHISDQTLTSEVNENPTILSGSKALQSMTTDLLSLDIPVNIRYTFSERKDNAMYVAAGISSLAYLGETTQSEFLVPSTIATYQEGVDGEIIEVYQTVQISEIEVYQSEAFEQFDLAGQLNLSFGYSYKLNNQLRLIAEPYYKHPLSKLGNSELSFSTAGVNLRLNFGFK